MNCPYCGNEMKPGMLVGDNRVRIKWKEASRRYSKIDKFFGVDGKSLQGIRHTHLGSVFEIEANHCPDCQKFIFDAKVDMW